MPTISIMQGRLSSPQGNRIQFFPTDWEEEFTVAKELGFAGITWFLDYDAGLDPIARWQDSDFLARVDRAREILPIHSIDCGLVPLFGPDAEKTLAEFEVLLPALAPRLQSKVVCIALLLHTAPKSEKEIEESITTLKTLANMAGTLDLKIGLETEMPAGVLLKYIETCDSSAVGVCYDVGSATAYGFDCPAEIEQLGENILEVHLKDHKREHVIGKDRSVELGLGDTDFEGAFRALRHIGYSGGYTMQAARGEDYLGDATRQLDFVTKLFQKVYG